MALIRGMYLIRLVVCRKWVLGVLGGGVQMRWVSARSDDAASGGHDWLRNP
jgi:hypothetical protein